MNRGERISFAIGLIMVLIVVVIGMACISLLYKNPQMALDLQGIFLWGFVNGNEACDYYDGHSLRATKVMVNKNKIFGMVESYVFDTKKDMELAQQILLDADGWETNAWEVKEIEE